jgi:hypothetical protein
LAVKHIV